MSGSTNFYRALYHTLIAIGRPFGGIRPRRLYDSLGRKAYPFPNPRWTRNRWGHELLLSHHFHLDRNILIHGDYDHALHLLFQSRIKPRMTILDVGANLGEMSLHLASLAGERGTVHAFEPFTTAFERLQSHIERNKFQNRIHPWPLALSNSPGHLSMTIPAAGADNQGMGSILPQDRGGTSITATIEATTLDAFVQSHDIRKVDFIKMDIQGAEYFCLEGARRTLERDRPEIVMEVSPKDLRGIGKTSRDLLKLVESLGYGIFSARGGKLGPAISPAAVREEFAATNVLCLPSRQ